MFGQNHDHHDKLLGRCATLLRIDFSQAKAAKSFEKMLLKHSLTAFLFVYR